MSDYGWLIYKDHLDKEDIQVIGPRDIPDALQDRLLKGEGIRFKLYDDDGELYYSGRIIFTDASLEVSTPHDYDGYRLPLEGSLPEIAGAPLWDYGIPAAGATEIRFKGTGKDKRWSTF